MTRLSTYCSLVRGGFAMKNGYTRSAGWPFQRLPVVDMIEASDSVRCGWRAAKTWAIIPPIEAPTMCAASIPRLSSRPATSSAMSTSV